MTSKTFKHYINGMIKNILTFIHFWYSFSNSRQVETKKQNLHIQMKRDGPFDIQGVAGIFLKKIVCFPTEAKTSKHFVKR